MPGNDRKHFDEYRVQTLVKHTILEGYLPAYFTALSSKERLGYLDAFAGRGHYTKDDGTRAPGSPIRALDLICADPRFHEKIVTIFAEPDPVLFCELQQSINSHKGVSALTHKPGVMQAEFAGVVAEMKKVITQRMIPVFLFVDPCGAKGVDFASMKWILEQPGSELFLFFNSSAMRRIVGAVGEPGNRDILDSYLGSTERTDQLICRFRACDGARCREQAMLDALRESLRSIPGVQWVLPFRVEYESREDTSHYLVHATKSGLGFRLMKYAMIDFLQKKQLTDGELELRQASYAMDLFAGTDIKDDVLAELRTGPKNAGHFKTRTERADNFWSEGDYKRAILALEESNTLEVFETIDCTKPLPREKRMRKVPGEDRKEPTLGDGRGLKIRA